MRRRIWCCSQTEAGSSRGKFFLGITLYGSSQFGAAKLAFERELAGDPKEAAAMEWLGRTEIAMNEPSKAVDIWIRRLPPIRTTWTHCISADAHICWLRKKRMTKCTTPIQFLGGCTRCWRNPTLIRIIISKQSS